MGILGRILNLTRGAWAVRVRGRGLDPAAEAALDRELAARPAAPPRPAASRDARPAEPAESPALRALRAEFEAGRLGEAEYLRRRAALLAGRRPGEDVERKL